MSNPATRYGPIAEQEYDRAGDAHKPTLAAWLDKLPTLSDADFSDEAASAIHGSALVNSFRGNWEHEHCKASAAHNEAQRRHKAAGHTEDCRGDTIYSRAFAQVWREQGHAPSAYPPKPCDCGAQPVAA
jgi:hypothetical protein